MGDCWRISGDVSSTICRGQCHFRNWHPYKDEQSHVFKISRQTEKKKDRQKVGRINWCRDECVCVGLCCFSVVDSECRALANTGQEKLLYNDVHDLHHSHSILSIWEF